MTNPVNHNTLKQVFFTGLPPGDEHDRIVAEGSDFIVFQIEEDAKVQAAGFDQGPYALPNCPERALSFLEWACFMDWCRVRATSAEDAIAIYEDARDQCVAETNGSPQWQQVVTFKWGTDDERREDVIAGKTVA